MIGSPSVTTPAAGPSVAVAMTLTVEVLTPPKTSGSASGSSTRRRICAPVRPIAAGGVDHLGIDLAHAGVGVEQDGRDGEQDERERDVEEARAQGREEQEDDADRRDRAPGVGHGHDEERAAPAVAQPQPDRQRDRGGDPHGDEA